MILTLFVVAGHTFGGHCFSLMLDSDAICRGRRHFWKSLLAFDAWFWCYMWCSRALGHFIVCLRCLTLTLFVVFQSTWSFYCLPSMLDFDAICRGRTRFSRSLLFFDAWSWRYLSWPDIFWRSLLAFRSWLWTLFVVFQSTWPFYCLPSMLDFDAICGVPKHLAILLFAFDAWLWRY